MCELLVTSRMGPRLLGGSVSVEMRRCAGEIVREKNVKSEMRKRCIGGEEKLVVERDGG